MSVMPAPSGPDAPRAYGIAADSTECPKCGHAVDLHAAKGGCSYLSMKMTPDKDGFLRATGENERCSCDFTDREVVANLEAGQRFKG